MSDSDAQGASDVRLAAESQAAPLQVAGYRLLRRLGRGAMAEVYLAEQCSLRRHVALKILRANLASEPSYVKRFQLEAQAAASLVHPNIVQIYEVGCDGGLHFIAQEYVPGLSLREWLARNGSAPLPMALGVIGQVAAALAKASQQGIVHRDIKPDNIMVSSTGEVKVADFGLARLSTSDTRLTQEGFTLGTPLYMSPEQVEGRPLDTRSDIYSLGVTSYHMLSGQPPFGGDTALQVAVKHLRSEPQPLGQVRSDLPPALCDLVHKMLAKDPDNRFATAQELSRSLRSIAAACGVTLDEHSHASLSAGTPAVAASRQVLTRELQVLMRREPTGVGRWGWPLAAAVVAAFLVGLATARLTRPTFLLSSDPSGAGSAAPAASPTPATTGEQATAGPATAEAATTGRAGDEPRLNEAGMPQPAPREQGGGGGNSSGPGGRRPVGLGDPMRRGGANRPGDKPGLRGAGGGHPDADAAKPPGDDAPDADGN